MDPKSQAVYDAAIEAAEAFGRQDRPKTDDELIVTVMDSALVRMYLPKYGVGNLPPTLTADLRAAYNRGLTGK